jgi:hypothetical protein
VGVHAGWTHFVVRQPDGGVHIAIDTEKLAKVTSLAGRTDQMDRPSRLARGSVSSAPLLGTPQSVIALQGSDHRRFWCHRAWYISAMSTYMIFNIVLIPLCVTQHSGRNASGAKVFSAISPTSPSFEYRACFLSLTMSILTVLFSIGFQLPLC